ncbi:cytochrome P450 [Nonomuraea sp. B10E15]|uniref:cytochrome P450 family protein n=1 Tax=unclassified Nonomuraea TaxID=2593643 RepID=UPI00325C9549
MDDAYSRYATLREAGPVHRVATPLGGEAYMITRYEEARAALHDQRLSKHPKNAPGFLRDSGLVTEAAGPVGVNMLSSDPPDHTRLRRVVGRAFTPRRVEALRPRIQQITDDLLDALPTGEEIDLIDRFAFQLPITVICEMLGVPVEDRDRFRAWTRAMTLVVSTPDERRRREEGMAALEVYLSGLIERCRSGVDREVPHEDQPDLLSALIVAADERGELDEDELRGTLMLLLIAGHETTVNLIGNGTLALLRNRDQLDALIADPGLLPSAVEELLRYDSPVENATFRFTLEDVELGGFTIPAGNLVLVSLAGADRDPLRFDRPGELDLARGDNPHLAFGHGMHFCLGAPLARLEGMVAFASLFGRFPGIRLACPAEQLRLRYQSPLVIVRGLEALPVVLER